MSHLPFRNALVAIYDADSAVQAVTGRTELNLLPRGVHRHEENLPVLTYFIIISPKLGGVKGSTKVSMQFEAWCKEADANVFTKLETLIDRAEVLFVGANLNAQGIDAYRKRMNSRDDGGVENDVRSIRTVFDFVVTE